MSESVDRQVTEARNEVRQVCDWLLRPSAETMEACAPALERALGHVHELYIGAQPMCSNPGLVEALRALAGEIQSAQALLGAAGNLYFGRVSRLATPDADRRSTAEPIGSISVTG